MEKIHVNSLVPYKKPSQSNNYTKSSSKLRISVKRVIRELKKFRSKYKDRRMKFEIRIRLLSGIYNLWR